MAFSQEQQTREMDDIGSATPLNSVEDECVDDGSDHQTHRELEDVTIGLDDEEERVAHLTTPFVEDVEEEERVENKAKAFESTKEAEDCDDVEVDEMQEDAEDDQMQEDVGYENKENEKAANDARCAVKVVEEPDNIDEVIEVEEGANDAEEEEEEVDDGQAEEEDEEQNTATSQKAEAKKEEKSEAQMTEANDDDDKNGADDAEEQHDDESGKTEEVDDEDDADMADSDADETAGGADGDDNESASRTKTTHIPRPMVRGKGKKVLAALHISKMALASKKASKGISLAGLRRLVKRGAVAYCRADVYEVVQGLIENYVAGIVDKACIIALANDRKTLSLPALEYALGHNGRKVLE